jgi:hypothetical protein
MLQHAFAQQGFGAGGIARLQHQGNQFLARGGLAWIKAQCEFQAGLGIMVAALLKQRAACRQASSACTCADGGLISLTTRCAASAGGAISGKRVSGMCLSDKRLSSRGEIEMSAMGFGKAGAAATGFPLAGYCFQVTD